MDFVTGSNSNSDWDNISPYRVMDGKWGGFGPSLWFRFSEISERDVFERGYGKAAFEYIWVRVWDDTQQKWRDITPEEHGKLPSLKEEGERARRLDEWQNSPAFMENMGKIMFPMIRSAMPELIMNDIVGVQPMTGSVN